MNNIDTEKLDKLAEELNNYFFNQQSPKVQAYLKEPLIYKLDNTVEISINRVALLNEAIKRQIIRLFKNKNSATYEFSKMTKKELISFSIFISEFLGYLSNQFEGKLIDSL